MPATHQYPSARSPYRLDFYMSFRKNRFKQAQIKKPLSVRFNLKYYNKNYCKKKTSTSSPFKDPPFPTAICLNIFFQGTSSAVRTICVEISEGSAKGESTAMHTWWLRVGSTSGLQGIYTKCPMLTGWHPQKNRWFDSIWKIWPNVCNPVITEDEFTPFFLQDKNN